MDKLAGLSGVPLHSYSHSFGLHLVLRAVLASKNVTAGGAVGTTYARQRDWHLFVLNRRFCPSLEPAVHHIPASLDPACLVSESPIYCRTRAPSNAMGSSLGSGDRAPPSDPDPVERVS